MSKLIFFIAILMGCATALIATFTKYDVSPLGICIIFLVMAAGFCWMIENS